MKTLLFISAIVYTVQAGNILLYIFSMFLMKGVNKKGQQNYRTEADNL